MIKLDGMTPDLAQENIEKLKGLFPDVFTEGKVDFDKLQQVLGNYIETSPERYNFTWNGKNQALRLAQTPSLGTLRPCKEESKDWDTTENLYIEGDNLEVLKLLQKSYHGKVKMIYIDPPYNTGSDFVYPDNFTDSMGNYKVLTGQVDSEGNAISSNSETSGRYHTDWLNMMYPRLKLARNLLAEDGVIFISIDDNEQDNLKKLCNEVFGEGNFIGNIIWQKKFSRANDATYFSTMHDYILCYAKKHISFNTEGWQIGLLPRGNEVPEGYSNPDNDPRGNWTSVVLSAKSGSEKLLYKITTPSGRICVPPSGRFWSVNEEKFKALLNDNRIWFGKNGDGTPRQKTFLSEVQNGLRPNTIWLHNEVGHNQEGKQETKELFNGIGVFDGPKPVRLLRHICTITNMKKTDIILDFFSGSATTAHAVMQLNAEDQGNRKFIMVQLPELCDEKSEAYKAGYANICEIGKERIRRAGEKVKEESGLTAADIDIGFKVFKLNTSNIRKWEPDYDNIEQSLTDYVDNYVDGRSEFDVVYEIMLKCGLDLTYAIDEYEVGAKKIYAIGYGALMICLADNITTDVAQEMVKLKNQLSPETWKVVFKDNGFKSDSDKTNIKEILKCGGLEEDAFTTL